MTSKAQATGIHLPSKNNNCHVTSIRKAQVFSNIAKVTKGNGGHLNIDSQEDLPVGENTINKLLL